MLLVSFNVVNVFSVVFVIFNGVNVFGVAITLLLCEWV